jgi:hypothetical protein
MVDEMRGHTPASARRLQTLLTCARVCAYWSQTRQSYGLGGGVGRGLGVGANLGVGDGLAVPVGVGETVPVAVGVGVTVGVVVGVDVVVAVGLGLAVTVGVGLGGGPDCAQYLPPLSRLLVSLVPPQTII